MSIDLVAETLRTLLRQAFDDLRGKRVPMRNWHFVEPGPSPHIVADMVLDLVVLQLEAYHYAERLPQFEEILNLLPQLARGADIISGSPSAVRLELWSNFVWPAVKECILRSPVQDLFSLGPMADETVESVVHEIAAELQGPRSNLVLITPLVGLDYEGTELTISTHARIRPLAKDEIESWLNAPTFAIRGPNLTVAELPKLYCGLEVDHEPSEPTINGESQQLVDNLVAAVSLVTGKRIRPLLTEIRRSGILGGPQGTISHPERTRVSELVSLSSSTLVDVKRVLTVLESSPNLHKAALALSRWNSAAARDSVADELIDYWIALESLFLQDSHAELAYRVAFRVSAFIGQTSDESAAIYRTVLASYKARSRVVHGSSADVPKLKTVTADTSELLRRSLLEVLQLKEPFNPSDIEITMLRAAK